MVLSVIVDARAVRVRRADGLSFVMGNVLLGAIVILRERVRLRGISGDSVGAVNHRSSSLASLLSEALVNCRNIGEECDNAGWL